MAGARAGNTEGGRDTVLVPGAVDGTITRIGPSVIPCGGCKGIANASSIAWASWVSGIRPRIGPIRAITLPAAGAAT